MKFYFTVFFQFFHCFEHFPFADELNVRIVKLVDIDIVCLEPLEAFFDSKGNIFSGKVRACTDIIKISSDLGGDDKVFSFSFKGFADELFTVTVTVHIGRVEEVAAEFNSLVDSLQGIFVIGGAVAVSVPVSADGPCAETDFRDFQPCFSKPSVFHHISLEVNNA